MKIEIESGAVELSVGKHHVSGKADIPVPAKRNRWSRHTVKILNIVAKVART